MKKVILERLSSFVVACGIVFIIDTITFRLIWKISFIQILIQNVNLSVLMKKFTWNNILQHCISYVILSEICYIVAKIFFIVIPNLIFRFLHIDLVLGKHETIQKDNDIISIRSLIKCCWILSLNFAIDIIILGILIHSPLRYAISYLSLSYLTSDIVAAVWYTFLLSIYVVICLCLVPRIVKTFFAI